MNRREVTLNGTTYPLNGTNTVSITGATYPLSNIEDLVFVNTGSNDVALTLPDPANLAGRSITIKKTNTGANKITCAAYASENIEGAAGPYTLPNSDTAARGTWTLASDGTNWWLASTANTATGGGGNVSGTPVAGGKITVTAGVGAVSDQWGGLALRLPYTTGNYSYNLSFTASATPGVVYCAQVSQITPGSGTVEQAVMSVEFTAGHSPEWVTVSKESIPAGLDPDLDFFITIFAVYP